MAKAILFDIKKILKSITSLFKQDLDEVALVVKSLLEKEYAIVIAEIGKPQYTPLHNEVTYRGKTYNPNFKGSRGNYYKHKFEQREALYETMKPKVRYQVDAKNKTITFGVTVEDGNGHVNNLFYWLDLGTSSKPQNRSPFIKGNTYVENSTAIPARNYSKRVAENVENYILKTYGDDIKLQIPILDTSDVDWYNTPLTRTLPK